MAYLTYIVSHYHGFHTYVLSIHGHETSWHREADLVRLRHDPRVGMLEAIGYILLSCDWSQTLNFEL